jgi:nucleoside-diphosphate-sugar epimerase
MKILVTGAAGHLGSATARELLKHGHDVVSVDIRPPQTIDTNLPPVQVLNVTQLDALQTILKQNDVEAICHIGNRASLPAPMTDGFTNNVGSNHAVFEAAINVGIRRIVYASSVQVYGVLQSPFREATLARSTPRYLPIDEDHPMLPTDAYPLSKAIGEITAEAYCRQSPLSVFSLRFSAIVTGENPAKVPPQFSIDEYCLRRMRSTMLTYIGLADSARAVRLACETDAQPGHVAMNIVAPRSLFPWKEAFIKQTWNNPIEIRSSNPNDPLYSCKRAEKVLGFRAETLPDIAEKAA